jgi:hypothetical protein
MRLGFQLSPWHYTPRFMALGRSLFLLVSRQRNIVASRFSMDSDLEAFSHNPTDGSFAALAFQPTANTNYLNQGFLSY